MSSSSHPIWSIVRLTVLMIALSGVLYATASKFDSTELHTIIYTFLAAASGEGIISMLKNTLNKDK